MNIQYLLESPIGTKVNIIIGLVYFSPNVNIADIIKSEIEQNILDISSKYPYDLILVGGTSMEE